MSPRIPEINIFNWLKKSSNGMKIILANRREMNYFSLVMQHATIKNTPAAISILSLVEFLDCYFNTEVAPNGDLLVSNREENFTIGFSPLTMDGKEIPIEKFVLRIAKGDESIIRDWNLHTERFEEDSPDDDDDETGE
jgi:hypothetical protein